MAIPVSCTACGATFSRSTERINESLKMRWKSYCSRKCQYQSMLRGTTLRCNRPGCNVKFYRLDKEAARVGNCYCSRSCATIINNQQKPKRTGKQHLCGNEICGKMVPMSMMYCSRKCRWTKETEFSNDELQKQILTAFERLGRTPAKRELGRIAHMCIRAFGSWNKALKAARLVPNRSHSQRMYKRTNTVAADGHRCDSISEAIIDNWLTKNNIAHDRNVLYPNTKHKVDWRIHENIFVEYFGLAKDSPRYDRSIQEKRRLCRTNGIRLIEIYPADLYPRITIEKKFAGFV